MVRDFTEISFDRNEFKASLNVDVELRNAWKIVPRNYVKLIYSIPISLVFMSLVIGMYIGIQFWQFEFIKQN